MRFHRRCGDRVTLLNDNCTAVRNFVEFNHGLILSAESLQDDVLFEVCLDRKVNAWNGSLEIGVTCLDPDYIELPATATKLRNSAWILSGTAIVKDGLTINGSYGPELNTLQEGDCIGVMRTSKAQLMFYINGRCLGVAARDMPPRLFAVIDLYGQCVQVTIVHSVGMQPIMESSMDQEDPNNDDTLSQSEYDLPPPPNFIVDTRDDDEQPSTSQNIVRSLVPHDTLRFHPRCGILVKLTNNNRAAERARPLDDYNNGVVMTHRPLYDNELFEIRIEQLVDKWSGSIEVGVTSHNPATLRFPSTMTNMDSGTIMLSGCKVLVNGRGTCKEYGNFNLDELREGETVGLMRHSNGKLHYFINGVDQGEAKDKVGSQVWGVVDLYGMTVKVTIVDPISMVSIYTDNNIHHVPITEEISEARALCSYSPRLDEDSLLFHTLRDSNVVIINDGKTAHRPNAFEVFNNGIVMTNRTLKTNELFLVRLDLVIPKWAGSIEIGVTQRSCNEIQLPFKMSNALSATWAMAGEDVIREDTIIIPQYVRNLNRLLEGDTVGVMRKDLGILHFFVNGIDQGPAAFNIPEHVFGIIDLYGRVAQASIVDNYLPPPDSPDSPLSTESNATIYPEMCFHHVHGCNARLSRSRLTASRATFYSEFNDAVLFSSRPLRECEMFEVRIDKMVDGWIGSLEMGVTAMKPDDLESNNSGDGVAGTATALRGDTYILSGGAMMKDGECMRSCYRLNLDCLCVGSRVGMMWHADRSLHYYLDGMDQGRAWHVPHLNVYAVVDLYGRCTQVSIIQNEERAFNYNGYTYTENYLFKIPRISPPQPYCFSEYCGTNVLLRLGYSVAARLSPDPNATLVFSAAHLAVGELFEIKVLSRDSYCAGGLRIGITDINILNAHVNRSLPPAIDYLPHYTAYVDGNFIKYSRSGATCGFDLQSIEPNFEWLRQYDRVGLKKTNDGRVLIYYNSEQLDSAFEKVPDKVYVVLQLYGRVTSIQALSKLISGGTSVPQPIAFPADDESLKEQVAQPEDSTTVVTPTNDTVDKKAEDILEIPKPNRPPPYTFHHLHGNNITLCSSDTVAIRTAGYTDSIVIASRPLETGQSFVFRVDNISNDWAGCMTVGTLGQLPTEVPVCALSLEPPCWVVSSELVNINGSINKSTCGARLNYLHRGSVVAIHFTEESDLLLEIDGFVTKVAALPQQTSMYPMIELYGSTVQVSTLLHYNINDNLIPIEANAFIQPDFEPNEIEDEPQPGPSSSFTDEYIPDFLRKWSSLQNLKSATNEYKLMHKKSSDSSDTLKLNYACIRAKFVAKNRDTNIENNHQYPEAAKKTILTQDASNIDPILTQDHQNGNSVANDDTSQCSFSGISEAQENQELQSDVESSKNKDLLEEPSEELNDSDNEAIQDVAMVVEGSPKQSQSADCPIATVAGETRVYAPQNMVYFRYLITSAINLFRQYSNDDGDSIKCCHMQNVYQFCKYVLSWDDQKHFWRKIDCYCRECRPSSTQEEAGWAYLLVTEPFWRQNFSSHAYWHINVETVSQTPDTRGKGERPVDLPNSPFQDATFTETWYLGEETYKGKLVLDVDISPDSSDFDKLAGFWVQLQRASVSENAPCDRNHSR